MRQFNKVEQEKICHLYRDEGWTQEDIRKYYHCRKEAIRNVLTINNIPKRGNVSKNVLLRQDYFDIIDCEEKAYFLGLLFADGSVVKDNQGVRSPMISLQLKVEDIDLVKAFKEELRIGTTLTFDKRENKECVSVRFRNQHMADALEEYGIIQNKTYNTNHLPKVPQEFLKDFLRGLLDGDGSIYKNDSGKYFIDFCSYHKTICEDFRDYIAVFNIENTNKIENYGTAYHIRYASQSKVKEIATLLYKDSKISLARKYCLAEQLFN